MTGDTEVFPCTDVVWDGGGSGHGTGCGTAPSDTRYSVQGVETRRYRYSDHGVFVDSPDKVVRRSSN